MRETPVQKAIREMEIAETREMERALKGCKTPRQHDRCIDAHCDRMIKLADAIGQQHGLPGMSWLRLD